MADVAGGALGLDLGVRCRTLDEEVPSFRVPTPYGNQQVQLPVLRSLHVETRADVVSGATVAIAGVAAGETHAVVLVTPQLIDSDGLQNVLVEARVLIAQGEPKEPKKEPGRSDSLKDFELTGWEGFPVALEQASQRDFVSGYQDGEPVLSPVETGARLQFTPATLGGDDVSLQIGLRASHLDPVAPAFPVKVRGGKGPLDLPIVHSLELDLSLIHI